jgi:hypothetical protein
MQPQDLPGFLIVCIFVDALVVLIAFNVYTPTDNQKKRGGPN